MKHVLLVLLVGGMAVVGGCLADPGATTGGSPTPTIETPTLATGTPTTQMPTTETSTPLATGTVTESDALSVKYVVRVDSLPANVSHMSVDFSVYFAEDVNSIRSCTGSVPLMDNQYDPTPTALPTPEGECHQGGRPTVTLSPATGSQSLGTFTAPGRFDGAYMLSIHDVRVVLDNGTTASEVYDTDFRAHIGQEPASGTVGVAFTVEHGTDIYRGADYLVTADVYEPGD